MPLKKELSQKFEENIEKVWESYQALEGNPYGY